MPNVRKGKGMVLTNSDKGYTKKSDENGVHKRPCSPEELLYLFSSQLFKTKSKLTPAISSGWINRVSNPSHPVPLPRKSPIHLLFLLQYQLWETFLLSREQQTENSCMKPSANDSINRPRLGTEDVIIKTPGSGESLSKLWNARKETPRQILGEIFLRN